MSKIFFKNDNFFCQLIPSPQKEVTEHHRALCYDNDLKIKLTFKLATITYINIALSILNQKSSSLCLHIRQKFSGEKNKRS